MKSIFRLLSGLALLLALAAPAHASAIFTFTSAGVGSQVLSVTTTSGVFNINAFDMGWYDAAAVHLPANTNYAICSGGEPVCNAATTPLHDFFAFRLGTIEGTFLSAQLSLFNPAGGAAGTTNTVWYDFTGDVNALLAGTGGLAAFNDLASGVLFGTKTTGPADNNTQVIINLNGAALAAISAALSANQGSGIFVIGGSAAEVPVPEPMTLTLVGLGMAAGAVRRFAGRRQA